MKKISPFTTLTEATDTLDNGGRFYNLMTHANDGIISRPELGKVAGVYRDKQAMVLYYALAVADLDKATEQSLLQALTDDLKEAYLHYKPAHFLPSQAVQEGELQDSVIVTGIPRHIGARTDFKGFVLIPIMAGKVMVMTIVPIIDKYDVYELRDDAQGTAFLVAHARGKDKLPEENIRIAGILKELKLEKNKAAKGTIFLEGLYWAEV